MVAAKKVGDLEQEKPKLKDFAKTAGTDFLIQAATYGAGKLATSVKNAGNVGQAVRTESELLESTSRLKGKNNFTVQNTNSINELNAIDNNVGDISANATKLKTVDGEISTDWGSVKSKAQRVLPDAEGGRLNKIAASIKRQEVGFIDTEKTRLFISDDELNKMGKNISSETGTNSGVGAAFCSRVTCNEGKVGKAIILREKDTASKVATLETKHELRHWKFDLERRKGNDTLYDGSIESNVDGKPISDYHSGAYSGYQSLEEVSTHSLDLASTVKRVKDVNAKVDVNAGDVQHFQDRAYILKEIAEQTLSTKEEVMSTLKRYKISGQSLTDRTSEIAVRDLKGIPEVSIATERYTMKVKLPTNQDRVRFTEYEDITSKLDISENSFGLGKKLTDSEKGEILNRKKELERYFVERAETKLTDTYGQTKETYDRLRKAVEKSDKLLEKGVVSGKEYNQFVDDVRHVSGMKMMARPNKTEVNAQ